MVERPVRIAQLIISVAWGGAENVAYNLARHLASETKQYVIVNEEIVEHYRDLEDSGVTVLSLGPMYDCSPRMRPLRYFRARRILKQFIKEHDIDVIHFHLVWGIIAYYTLFRPLKRTTLITLHGIVRSSHLGMRTRIENFVLWRSLKYRIDRIVSCSNELLDYPKKENAFRPDVSSVIHNGINEAEWESVQTVDFVEQGYESGSGPKPFRILFVGQMRPMKGMDLLVEAIHLIHEERLKEHADDGSEAIPLKAYIIGTGDLMPRMKQMVSDYGLQDTVHLLGFKSKEDLFSHYRSCDVLCSLCDWEGCSIVQLEAMAAGIPLIATNLGGTPEIISHGRNGYLVERSVSAIKDAILHASAHPDELAEMRKNNLSDREKHYWSAVVTEYLPIYRELGTMSRQRRS